MHPAIEVAEAEPEADRRLLESLADWCDRYTPLVALDGEDGLFLDVTGCAHLFGGEHAMLDDVLARFRHQGFDVRAAIASTPGAAWAAARHACGAVVEAGEEAALITPLPLAALRLDAPARAGLESVGLRVAGALMSAPRAPLARRFGRSVMLRLDQALGGVEEPISPCLTVPELIAERRFAEPVVLLEEIEALVVLLSRQLKARLEHRGEGAEKLQLQLFRVDGGVYRIAVSASRPLRDPELVHRLFREKLAVAAAGIDAGYGFDLVRLAVMAAGRFDEDQATLGEAANAREGDLALFADRLRARLGEQAIVVPRMVESHWPEKAAPLVPFAAHGETAGSRTTGEERPLRLFAAPEGIEVTAAEVPEGPPGRFRWRSVSYRVVSAEGPERIAPEWWQAGTQAETRDYFRVEDEAGRRYWVYREGRYGAPDQPPRWYMQGMFA